MGKECVTLILRACNEDLGKISKAMQLAMRKAMGVGLLRVMVNVCEDLDFDAYIRELNSNLANNFNVSVVIYEYNNLEEIIKGMKKDISGCTSGIVMSTIDIPSINYEKISA